MSLRPIVIAGLALSLVIDGLVAGYFLFGRAAPAAAGQASSGADGFLMATEKLADQTPICFVISTKNPHLCVYRTDARGMLILMDSRDMNCDLNVIDSHFGMDGRGAGVHTMPAVAGICNAVGGPKSPAPGTTKAEDSKQPPSPVTPGEGK